MQRAAGRLLPHERVANCLRLRVPNTEGVEVYRREDSATYYANLQACGSVWCCPVCAAKVSERRRVELVQALEEWKRRGGQVYLVTLTVPHYAGYKAFGLVETVLDLVRKFWSGRGAASGILPGYAGQIRALEVTHGENGWHPHVHILVFLERALEDSEVFTVWEALYARWSSLVGASGLGTPNKHGLTLQDGSEAAKYAGKWGLPEELTKAHIKQARRRGRTPFALLADHLDGDDQAGRLFREFARAFKGKRQLFWSRGLRDLLGLAHEKSDDELAASVDALDALLGVLEPDDWRLVLQRELRGEVLEVARSGDWSAVRRLLELHRHALNEEREFCRRQNPLLAL